MKHLLKILILIVVLLIVGCESIKLDGFSVGVIYLNTNVTTTESINAGRFGQLTGKHTMKVEEFLPVGLLNFKFE